MLHRMNIVDAVETKAEIEVIENQLRKHHGVLYGDIWRTGVNLAYRISDLLQIEYADLDIQSRSYTRIESKTGKNRQVRLNNKVVEIIERRKKENPNDRFLFQVKSNRTTGTVKPISRVSVGRAFKDVGERLGLNIGTHTMRKTRGLAMFSDGVPLEKISKVLNHSSTSTTMLYIGITQKEILDSFDEYEL